MREANQHPLYRHPLYWPYQIYVWLILLPLVVVLTLLAASLSVIVAVTISPEAGSRHVAMRWARLIAWLTPMRLKVSGRQHAQREQSYVVVSNHQSQYDILALYGWLDLDLKWVMKKELRKVPGIGIGCEKLGHIFVDRSDPEQSRAAINQALKKVAGGIGILFFPEGTRSLDGKLLRFKKGAFRVAIHQQIPVLPVSLIGTRDILPAKTLRLFPGRAEMKIHAPIATEGLSLDDMPALMARVRRTIQADLDGSDTDAG